MPASVRINRRGADRIASGHPWIYASDVLDRGEAAPGDAVAVASPRGEFFGIAHYSSASQISLRMLSAHAEAVDRAFFLRRLKAAAAHRERVVRDTTAYRLAYAEADLLPALIVDRYADCLVVQTLNQGMDRAKQLIAECLEELVKPAGIVARNDAPVRKREDLPLEVSVLAGQPPGRVAVEMNGLKFTADILHSQKTGLFLDQRENYVAAAAWAKGHALDAFTSTGGFALHMAARCESVEAIDSSQPALEMAEASCQANGIANVEFRKADVFEYLAGSTRRFSTVVLDPPAFAKTRETVGAAARGYKEINLRALKLLEPGGVLVSCSCSHHMSEAALLEIIASAALDAGKTLRVLERRSQAKDHPILLTVPETHYLKCLILEAVDQ